jgi:glycosyltransferase involved in cell wall biosynthesis
VRFLGRKPYELVARYMAAMDVLIMPWNRSAWIAACNPVKLKEYLAVGRPVVTSDFPALDGWRDLVRVADGADDFARQIRAALDTAHDPAPARRRIAAESWDAKTATIVAAIEDLGLTYVGAAGVPTWAALARDAARPVRTSATRGM